MFKGEKDMMLHTLKVSQILIPFWSVINLAHLQVFWTEKKYPQRKFYLFWKTSSQTKECAQPYSIQNATIIL